MNYWNTATKFSSTPTCISGSTISIINWSGIIVYTSVTLVMCIWSLITYPGYVNDDSNEQYYEWYFGPLNRTTNYLWLVMNDCSTFFLLVALFNLFRVLRKIDKWIRTVSLNKRSYVLHLLLLILITLVYSIFPFIPLLYDRNLTFSIITIFDMM